MRKKIWSLLLSFGALIAFLYWQAPVMVYNTKHPLIELIRKKGIPKQIELLTNQKNVEIEHDGLQLKGTVTTPSDSLKASIILVHGIRGNRKWWQSKSLTLAEQGIQTIAIDLRAHGESDGKYTSFGAKEKEDVQAWVDWIENQEHLDSSPLGIWGHSLGGAVALQSLAIDDRLEFGIAESTFHDFEVVAGDYSKEFIGFNNHWLTSNVIKRGAKLAGFQLEDARTIKACKHIQQPMLFMHGSQDDKINIDYNQQNYDAIPHHDKEFYTIEGAGHYNTWELGGEVYLEKVLDFVEKADSLNFKHRTCKPTLSPAIDVIPHCSFSSKAYSS